MNIELVPAATRIGFMGPHGTFTEQALLGQPDLAVADTHPFDSIPDVLNGLVIGDVDLGFVPIENAIEGAVNVTQDTLAFDLDVRIQRGRTRCPVEFAGSPRNATDRYSHRCVFSCCGGAVPKLFLREQLPDAEIQAATSTAEAARQVGEQRLEGVATISNPLAAELYGLEAVAEAVEDHTGNQTRFLLLAPKAYLPQPVTTKPVSLCSSEPMNPEAC